MSCAFTIEGISIVDTPGILSGEKQRTDRGYDFIGVLEWFAERVDRILLLFDAHKLDISDEFRRSIEALRGHDDKIRFAIPFRDSGRRGGLLCVFFDTTEPEKLVISGYPHSICLRQQNNLFSVRWLGWRRDGDVVDPDDLG